MVAGEVTSPESAPTGTGPLVCFVEGIAASTSNPVAFRPTTGTAITGMRGTRPEHDLVWLGGPVRDRLAEIAAQIELLVRDAQGQVDTIAVVFVDMPIKADRRMLREHLTRAPGASVRRFVDMQVRVVLLHEEDAVDLVQAPPGTDGATP